MANFTESAPAGETSDALVDARVIDASGNQATIVGTEQSGGDLQAWVQLSDGMQVLVPATLLSRQDDGGYRLPFTFHVSDEPAYPMQMTFPVMEEEMHVARRVVDTGRGVRLHKTVTEREQVLQEPLLRDALEVEHVPIGRVVAQDEMPQMRYEGETLVVPVLEEVLVVQKQLLLKEEVRITRTREQVQSTQTVLLRSEHVAVERFDDKNRAR
jgi:uncharacterized protein (TIGR02271 family)